ncbi:MAG: bifunctional glycosyltransferase family 2/GtrA family protein [Bryobacteraceae bacterium]|jgi:putative flippase GtrA
MKPATPTTDDRGTTSGPRHALAVQCPVVLIPAYKPADSLVPIVAELAASPCLRAVVVIDDGSGPEFSGIFAQLSRIGGVSLLAHVVNLGKGAALKTGLNYAACTFPESVGVVTADADGQHTVKDILRTAEALSERPQNLVLGARRFEGQVPSRSRLGNVLTRHVLRAVTGQRVTDTQTGLRGIPMGFISTLVRLRPNGYDFELEVLLVCKRTMRSVCEIPIETVYLDRNRSSHFNPLLDSMRIYFLLIRFIAVAMSTALLDNLVFFAAFHVLSHVLASQVLGRLVAGFFNYYMNKTSVFHAQVRASRALPRYWLSVVVFGAVSYGLINVLLALGFAVSSAKLCAETVLFAFSFVVQRDFVFMRRPAADMSPAE